MRRLSSPATMRRRIRKWLSWIASATVAVIVVPVLGQYFVELAREGGIYEQPSEIVGGVTNAVFAFVTQTWVLVFASFIVGLTSGMWLDLLLRNKGKALALRALDDLFAAGTGQRNKLLKPRPDFDYQRERSEFVAWSDEVLTKLDEVGVRIADQSRFRTLGTFSPSTIGPSSRSAPQIKLEAMWNEKLDQLRGIIDFFGA